MIIGSAFALSIIAVFLAAASLVVSWWQTRIKSRDSEDKRTARIAVDPGRTWFGEAFLPALAAEELVRQPVRA